MTENKRFKYSYSLEKVYDCDTFNGETTESYGTFECCDMLNQLNDENEQLKSENRNLKITISARDALIEVCEEKFRELGFIITVDDNGYVIE